MGRLPLLPVLLVASCVGVAPESLRPRARPAAEAVRAGDLHRRGGAREQARAAYEAALAEDPGERKAHVGLQVLALEEGRDLELRRRYRELGDPYLVGRLEGRERLQRAAYRSAVEPWRSLGLGTFALERGRLLEAVTYLDRAVHLDPGDPWGRIALGRALLARGRMAEAELEFRAAHWAEPLHPTPCLGLSVIADRRGNIAQAYRWGLEAYRRSPGDETLAERVHSLARRTRRRSAMRESADLLTELGDRGEGVALLLAADLHRRTRQATAAAEAAARARALGATEAEAAAASGPAVAPEIAPFVGAFVRAVEARYRHYAATGEAETFPQFVAWARDLFERTTGRTLGPAGRPRDFAFVGTLVDPRTGSDEPLVRACAEHGLVLVLGRRRGGPPEALLSEVVRRESGSVRVRGRDVERELIWTGRRLLSGYQEWGGGGDLAGVALGDVVLVDLHAVARWEGDLRRRLARLHPRREDLLRAEPLEDRPLASVDDPAGVADRLYLESALDLAGEVRVHEDAHLVDAARYLPVTAHPLRNLGLVLRHGFSASEILAFLERNAQLGAIAEGPSPRAALATCCAALGGEGVHARGYGEIVKGYVREIVRHPSRYPAIDAKRVIVQQLHRLSDDQIRSIARMQLDD